MCASSTSRGVATPLASTTTVRIVFFSQHHQRLDHIDSYLAADTSGSDLDYLDSSIAHHPLVNANITHLVHYECRLPALRGQLLSEFQDEGGLFPDPRKLRIARYGSPSSRPGATRSCWLPV